MSSLKQYYFTFNSTNWQSSSLEVYEIAELSLRIRKNVVPETRSKVVFNSDFFFGTKKFCALALWNMFEMVLTVLILTQNVST